MKKIRKGLAVLPRSVLCVRFQRIYNDEARATGGICGIYGSQSAASVR